MAGDGSIEGTSEAGGSDEDGQEPKGVPELVSLRRNAKISQGDMIAYFFKQADDANYFHCRNDKCKNSKPLKQAKGTGYSNLWSHLRSCIGEDFEQ